MTDTVKEVIAISYNTLVPSEWIDEFVRDIESQNFSVKKIARRENEVWASMEWAVPTLVVAIVLKPFFQSFMSEAGKDAYALAKQSLKRFILKNRLVKMRMLAATGSTRKLSGSYDQSLSVSVKAQLHKGMTATVLFNEEIPDTEAPEMVDGMFVLLESIYAKLQKEHPDTTEEWSRNNVYLIIDYKARQWKMLTEKEMSLRYRTPAAEHKTVTTMSEVFISYSWDNSEHEQKVINLTNHLREQGFNTTIDKMIIQQKTSANFVRMMHEAITTHPKVIVVLSRGYKEKAENFKGGVGEEYEILINDIKKNERKYILASFEGRGDDLVPIGLAGRDIIDLSQTVEYERLYGKLMDHEQYQFAPVGDKKPVLSSVIPQSLKNEQPKIPVIALPPRVTPTGNSGSTGDIYQEVELEIIFEFKNSSSRPVSEFGISIRIPRQLVADHSGYTRNGDLLHLEKQIERKLFAGQTITTHKSKFLLRGDNVHTAINAEITIEIFTEAGNDVQTFAFKDLVNLKPPNKHWMDAKPLELSMFGY